MIRSGAPSQGGRSVPLSSPQQERGAPLRRSPQSASPPEIMFFATAPPPRATTSRADGFSFLSWKGKIVLAASVILCGGGLAAQFPRLAPDPQSVASLDPAPEDSEYTEEFDSEDANEYTLAKPRRRYAQNANSATEQDYAFAEPAEPIRKYTPPPGVSGEGASDSANKSPELPSRTRLSSLQLFESVDYSGLEKTALDLPLANWNPMFDKAPPLSEPKSGPRIDANALVPSRHTVMKPSENDDAEDATEGLAVDLSALVPAETPDHTTEPKFEAILRTESLVPASAEPKFAPVLSLDQIRPPDSS